VLRAPYEDDRDSLLAEAAQKALERFDEIMRELALKRYQEFETELGPILTRFVVEETVRRFRAAGNLHWPAGAEEVMQLDSLAQKLAPGFGRWLAKSPALEDLSRLTRDIAEQLRQIGALDDPAEALSLKGTLPRQMLNQTAEFFGMEHKTFAGEVLE